MDLIDCFTVVFSPTLENATSSLRHEEPVVNGWRMSLLLGVIKTSNPLFYSRASSSTDLSEVRFSSIG